jgi:phage tail sheath protein FI
MVTTAPGVQWQDVYPPAPVAFRTGVPVFIGLAARAPGVVAPSQDDDAVGVAHPVRGWQDVLALRARLAAQGGHVSQASRVDAALEGFFGNGGVLCYLVRVDELTSPLQAVRAGLAAVAATDGVDLVCLPDLVAHVQRVTPGATRAALLTEVVHLQRAVLEHCAARGDRFAILDGLPGAPVEEVCDHVARLGGPSASYGALYHPWLYSAAVDGASVVPPSGHVAGVVAATDLEVGVHKAPANRPIEGIVDVEADLNQTEVARLYSAGVNAIRVLPGRGVRIWGSRTASTDAIWRDVPVRRLVSTTGRWVEQFMQGLVHEPNDVRLWVRIMRELSAHLESLHRQGALAGATPDEAFYVKCDHETNPPQVRDAGLVVTEIGMAPALPAEFIVVRVVQGANGVTVNAA